MIFLLKVLWNVCCCRLPGVLFIVVKINCLSRQSNLHFNCDCLYSDANLSWKSENQKFLSSPIFWSPKFFSCSHLLNNIILTFLFPGDYYADCKWRSHSWVFCVGCMEFKFHSDFGTKSEKQERKVKMWRYGDQEENKGLKGLRFLQWNGIIFPARFCSSRNGFLIAFFDRLHWTGK